MAHIRRLNNWNTRYPTGKTQIEPYRRYFIVCEGQNTERWYFEHLNSFRRKQDIHSPIEIIPLKKEGKYKNLSYPAQLVRYANKQKSNPEIGFDPERDKMIIIFDADIFEHKVSGYDELISKAEEEQNIIGVTNPCFELFLLLHYKDSYRDDIAPNADKILKNEKVGNHRYIYHLLLKRTGINSKTNQKIGKLAENISIAINQEQLINQDIHKCHNKLTSNIAKIIQRIYEEEITLTI
jgi:hypothetical protein